MMNHISRTFLLITALCISSFFSSTTMGTPFSGLKKFEDFFYNTKSIKKIPNNQISKVSQAPQALFTMTAPFDKKQQLVISLYEGENDYQQLIISYKSHTKSFVGKEIGRINLGNLRQSKVYLRGGAIIYVQTEGISYKYRLFKNKVKEVKQPFYYLGHDTRVQIPDESMCGPYEGPKKIKLYAQQKKDQVVATLTIGRAIRVILRDKDWYLIKTPFGLIGWAKNSSPYHSLFGFAESYAG